MLQNHLGDKIIIFLEKWVKKRYVFNTERRHPCRQSEYEICKQAKNYGRNVLETSVSSARSGYFNSRHQLPNIYHAGKGAGVPN